MGKELPKGWIETEVGLVSDLIRGVSYGKNDVKEIQGKNDFLILRGGNIQDGKILTDSSDTVFVNESLIKETQYIRKGDVIIVGSTGSKNLIGKAGIAKYDFTNISFGAFMMLIRPNSKLNASFFDYYFISDNYRNVIRDLAGGVNINNIRKEYITSLVIPLPSLPEQQRIVSKLDTLFEHLENTKTRLEKVPTLLKNFRQAVLTQAVTGKLTEEFPSKVVKEKIRIDRERWYNVALEKAKTNGTKKPKKIVFEVNGNDEALRKRLIKNTDIGFIEEIAAKKEYALKAGPFGSALKKEYYVPRGYKIYGQEQVIKGDAKYGDYYIDSERFGSLRSCAVATNDILISLVGTIGRVLILPEDHEPGIINPRLVKISLHNEVVPEFFAIYIKSPIAKDILDSMAHGGTMDVINLGILKKLPIPIPSKEEQTEIVRRVESLFAKAESIETKYQLLKEKIDNLPQTILSKAFKGELVEQLESDGDARELLEEIKKLNGKKK